MHPRPGYSEYRYNRDERVEFWRLATNWWSMMSHGPPKMSSDVVFYVNLWMRGEHEDIKIIYLTANLKEFMQEHFVGVGGSQGGNDVFTRSDLDSMFLPGDRDALLIRERQMSHLNKVFMQLRKVPIRRW